MAEPEAGGSAASEELRWSVWPARGRPLAAVVVLASIVVLGVLIAKATGDTLLGIAAPLFVAASLGSFLAKTEYRLTENTIEVRTLGVARTRPWSEMRRWSADATGIFLSPFASRSWLEAYRGLRLLFGGNRDQVMAFVEARLGKAASGGSDGRKSRARAPRGGKGAGTSAGG